MFLLKKIIIIVLSVTHRYIESQIKWEFSVFAIQKIGWNWNEANYYYRTNEMNNIVFCCDFDCELKMIVYFDVKMRKESAWHFELFIWLSMRLLYC